MMSPAPFLLKGSTGSGMEDSSCVRKLTSGPGVGRAGQEGREGRVERLRVFGHPFGIRHDCGQGGSRPGQWNLLPKQPPEQFQKNMLLAHATVTLTFLCNKFIAQKIRYSRISCETFPLLAVQKTIFSSNRSLGFLPAVLAQNSKSSCV